MTNLRSDATIPPILMARIQNMLYGQSGAGLLMLVLLSGFAVSNAFTTRGLEKLCRMVIAISKAEREGMSE